MDVIIKRAALVLVMAFWLQLSTIQGQISIQFVPALNGQSINGLFTAQLVNISPKTYRGSVRIIVRDSHGKLVIVTHTPTLTVKPGNNGIATVASQSRLQFGNNSSAQILSQTGRFPEDEYEYCFEFTGSENKVDANEEIFENCFMHLIQPVIPLSLIYPEDGDEICTTRPEFTWQPAMPVNRNLRYRLIVAEKNENQQAVDALMNTVPVFQQDNISGFILPYPPQVQELQLGKKYVWQVIAYEGNVKVTQSDVWEFNTECEKNRIDSVKESYRELSGLLNGNFYLARRFLRFSVTNPYNKVKMDYQILDLSNSKEKVTNLPEVTIRTGFNNIEIPLEDVKGIELNRMYLLTIRNVGNQPLLLRFIYKGDETQK